MRKVVKSLLIAAVIVATGFCTLKEYKFYNCVNNTLLLENIEAMSQSSGENTSCPEDKKKKCWKKIDFSQPSTNIICKSGNNGQPCSSKMEKVNLFSHDFGWCCNQ